MNIKKFSENFKFGSLSDVNIAQLMLRNLNKNDKTNAKALTLAGNVVKSVTEFRIFLQDIGMGDYGIDKETLTTLPNYKDGLTISTGINDLV
jgi:hypothetical protein